MATSYQTIFQACEEIRKGVKHINTDADIESIFKMVNAIEEMLGREDVAVLDTGSSWVDSVIRNCLNQGYITDTTVGMDGESMIVEVDLSFAIPADLWGGENFYGK